jgi:uncharacterized Zn finger protein (UPF0148 family)
MLCQICPRCQFRLAAGRHVCPTCGYSFAVSKKDAKAAGAKEIIPPTSVPEKAPIKPKGFWKSLFTVADEPTNKDEPALGES